ncbi:ATP-dependent Clp protease proteolytic subunit [Ensifer adhaerens]|uniref:ClpP-like prohead protease/major capsid protein fusion protein n=1 Tax=Ensifer adhaerens TaxID=106592 RepID=UPI001CBCA25D|nr:ClpP-like prohead protease/major capsid protein fusion protein [Ensifer adhaerens]MBZ7921650.1 ATP-dependent Clp protease proteolytic subunit [Ensifer adhaerens]UAX94065.1 ATP-dependent Clp protease proteolytic subunit [Ensifer adhaerens]UAY01699.1 ATP-dependent Clp protease proteolytic subunit [Ensifer adhaerens]UAY09083.1 ATP-dependent Clp protease proteolytic subunit [Ensifer adhaerens]
MSSLIVNGELVLYGPVGYWDWWEDTGFNSARVIEALAELSGDIVVRLNSGGGIAMEGSAIYNALKRHDGKVTIKIDAIAASAASVIAMAGDVIEMPHGTLMMIHEPAGITAGPADEHRRTAAVLDTMTGVFAQLYAERTGLSEAEIRKMMKDETWLSPTEAVAKGFATAATEAEAAATADSTFDYRTYMHAPAGLGTQARDRQAQGLPMVAVASAPLSTKETHMSKPLIPTADNPAPAPTASITPAPAPAPAADPAVVVATGDVVMRILELCTTAKMTLADANKIVADAGGDFGKAQTLVINHLAGQDPTGGRVSPGATTVTADGRDRFKQGAEKALLFKAGMQGGEVNEFTSMSLRELAREHLLMSGVSKLTMGDSMAMIGMALGMRQFSMSGAAHSSSDFVEILANIANKSMLKGYLEAGETFPIWTGRGVLTDFKPTKRVDLNLFPALSAVPEGGEYSFATIGDRGEQIQLATYGKMFSITRQAIINDDMSFFTKVPSRMGRAAIRTVGNLVYAVLTANAAMGDGITLFHADHDNVGTGALTTASLDAGRAAMAKQKDPDEHAAGGLNIRPAHLIVPTELEGKASQVINSEYEVTASGTNNTRAPNYARSMAQVVSEARLSADSALKWYLAASAAQHDTIEVAYLDGRDQPVLEQRDGWNVDGVEFKVRIDAAVKALDFRGLYRSTGA